MGSKSERRSGYHCPFRTVSVYSFTLTLGYLFTIVPSFAQVEFNWKVGPWGECIQASCGSLGRRSRQVECTLRSGQAVLDFNCHAESKPSQWERCSKPCGGKSAFGQSEVYPGESPLQGHLSSHDPVRESQDQGFTEGWGRKQPTEYGGSSNVEWVVSPFGSCRLQPGVMSCGIKSGIQYRNVTCQLKNSHRFADEGACLKDESKPAMSQACDLQCQQDCVVSDFTIATSCEDTACQMPNRTWTRRVIVPPRNGGAYCPDLSYMEPCPKCSTAFTYKFSEWSPCTKMAGPKSVLSHPLIGYQSRDITCLQSKGVVASLRSCSETLPRTTLVKARACVMPQDCQVSEWSSFSHMNDSCVKPDGTILYGYKVRTRQVVQFPMGEGRPCPPVLIDYLQQTVKEPQDLKPCQRAKWIKSEWSRCKEVPGHNNCGTGMQARTAICVEMDEEGRMERPVDPSWCTSPRPVEAKSCEVECHRDCSVSQWSDWSSCQTEDCVGINLRKRRQSQLGQKYRIRNILTLPGSSGQSCPHLSESRMCYPEPCFHWNITKEKCDLNRGTACGNGSQVQHAQCLNRDGGLERDLQCNLNLQSVKNWVDCYVPCPEDCVLGEWGVWSPCPDPCLGQMNVPNTRFRQRVILAYHAEGRNVRRCPEPNQLQESEKCPVLYDCATYRWEVGPWQSCTVDEKNLNGGLIGIENSPFQRISSKCGVGVQTRSVDCISSRGELADPSKCMEKIKPVSKHPCNVTCPIDCHVSEWSNWSACGVTCVHFAARQAYPVQYRKRYVLQESENGGRRCPSDLFEQQSCLELPRCQVFFWESSAWSDCILPLVVPRCGQGLQARNISCKQVDSSGTKQVVLSGCLEKLGNMPDVTQPCSIPCESQCQLSQWTTWTACTLGKCNKNRFRSRHLEGQSRDSPICRDTDRYPRDQHEECPCNTHQEQLVGYWSDCILSEEVQTGPRFAQMSLGSIRSRQQRTNETGSTGPGSLKECGKGKRYMALHCLDSENKAHGNLRCLGEQYRDENCSIPCPVDCQMSTWSEWTACSVKCGSGIRYRSRTVVTQSAYGGRMCPFLDGGRKDTQTKVCSAPCTYYKWWAEEWGVCRPHSTAKCGEGSHSRIIRCISVGSKGSELPAGESYCDPSLRPQAVKECFLPCPSECVLSEWSEWTRCREPCDSGQQQSRYRTVLRKPANYAHSQSCEDKEQYRACPQNCKEYAWELSDWTSCLVNDGQAECGTGHKEKFVICRNGRGEKVNPHFCEELSEPVTEPLAVSCEIPCDNDCLLSAWTRWGKCSTSCGLGITKRSRRILKPHVGHGRSCPLKLEQTKPCFQKGCYVWSVTDWSSCAAEIGICGIGAQHRNISCVNEEGRPVNSSKCTFDPEKLVLQTVRSCKIPCPGECTLSDWSTWTKCFVTCEDSRQGISSGVRVRSRAILAHPSPGNPACDTAMWQQEPCHSLQCSWFEWHASKWNVMTKLRRVVCKRNDGLEVTGPCNERLKPADTLLCENPVCVKPAVCRDTDTCACVEEPGVVQVLQMINSTAVTCVTNGTMLDDSVDTTKVGKSPNIWMYAVIAVGTLFVIAVTAALYNMCELFRTGPRPRRKGPASTTASSSNSLQILRHQKQQQQQLLRQQEELVGDCGNALDETNGSTVMTDFRGPTSPANGTVYKEENIYKQLNNGHGKEGWVAVGDGRGAEKAEKFSEDESYLQHPESSKISSERREAYIDEAFSDSKRSFVQPVPEPPIYNNFSSARQVPGNSSLPAPSSPWLQPAEFDPGDIPEIDDSSPLKTSSTLSSTMITATNTTNAATIMPTSASKNIKRDQTPVRGSSSGGGSSIVDESSHRLSQ